MIRAAALCAILSAWPVQSVLAADNDAMAKAANGFYDAYRMFHPSDGIPDAKGRARYAPYTSDGLNKLLNSAGAAQDKFAAANKDTPPLIEGDLFTSNFEGATTVKVGVCSGGATAGQCAVDLAYADPKTPLHWTDIAYLVNSPGGWRVDDIGYGGSWDFGNKGRLRDTLKMAINMAAP